MKDRDRGRIVWKGVELEVRAVSSLRPGRDFVCLDGDLQRNSHRASAASARRANVDASVSAARTSLAIVGPSRAHALGASGAIAHGAGLTGLFPEIALVTAFELVKASGGDEAAEDDARGERLVGEPLRIAYVNARTNCGIAAAAAARVSRRR